MVKGPRTSVILGMHLCGLALGGMLPRMGTRNAYRQGQAQVTVVLSPALRDRVLSKARRRGLTMQAAVVMLMTEWVEGGGTGGDVDARRGVPASADGGDPAGVLAGPDPAGLFDDPKLTF